jgi:lysosomal acid lipase/cholesteryl ester hydrolase
LHRRQTSSPTQQHRARERPSAIPSPKETTRLRARHLQIDDDAWPSSPDNSGGFSPRPARAVERDREGEQQNTGREWDLPTPRVSSAGLRRGSGGSTLSLETMREGRGISLGASKALGGVVTRSGAEGKSTGPGASGMIDSNTSRLRK